MWSAVPPRCVARLASLGRHRPQAIRLAQVCGALEQVAHGKAQVLKRAPGGHLGWVLLEPGVLSIHAAQQCVHVLRLLESRFGQRLQERVHVLVRDALHAYHRAACFVPPGRLVVEHDPKAVRRERVRQLGVAHVQQLRNLAERGSWPVAVSDASWTYCTHHT